MKNRTSTAPFVLFLLGCWGVLPAQIPDSMHLKRSITAIATFVTGDNLANIYLITSENAVVKLDSLGRKVASFTNNRLGRAGFLDVSNPLKVLVWYPDFQTVIVLDRSFTELGRLRMADAGLYAVRVVAMAFDGHLWVYDDAVSKAIKLSLDGAVLLESPPLQVYFPNRFAVTNIGDSGQGVYLNAPMSGLCVLDQYANLDMVYTTFRERDVATDGAWLLCLEKDRVYFRHRSDLRLWSVPLPPVALEVETGIWLSKHGLFLQRGQVLEQYSWE
ncbi:MAG: hypothetical protein RIQ78_1708 [Bacteroidota bacterium]